jgi:AcrR family transcriptional regulator
MRDGSKTKQRIIEAAVQCLAENGYERTTFQAIADQCGVSQQLVIHHLKKKENVFPIALDFILGTAIRQTESEMANVESSAEVQLKKYLEVSLKAFRSHPGVPKIYLTFYYLSGFDPKFLLINERIKAGALKRIQEILYAGASSGEFQIKDIGLTAKLIHTSLTGLLLNLATETQLYSDAQFLAVLESACLKFCR